MSEIISLALAILTTIAVIWAICLYFLQRRDARKKAEKEQQEEAVAVLVTLHQHFFICCKLIKSAWENQLPNLGFPASGLPTIGIEKTFEMAIKRLKDDPEMLQTIIHAYDDHCQLNTAWNILKKSSHDSELKKGSRSTLSSVKNATPSIYQVTWQCLNQIETHLKEIAPKIFLKEDSHSVPTKLGPFQEKPGMDYPWHG